MIPAGTPSQLVAGTFFIWTSVFNLFVVTLFWGTAVDLFSGEQAKRLFGLIFGAGTLGQLSISWFVGWTAGNIAAGTLLWISAGLLATGALCSWRLRKSVALHGSQSPAPRQVPSKAITAQPRAKRAWTEAWQGVTAVAGSRYLLGIATLVVSLSSCATVVYFQLADMAAELPDSSARLKWFAQLNGWHAYATLLMQTAVASWLLRRLGVGLTLALVPLVFCLGFATLSITQTLLAVGIFQVVLRVASFSFGSPALEVLFTAVRPDEKYRAKAFIDTVAKRTGDVAGAQGYSLLITWGCLPATLALGLVPLALALSALAIALGKAQQQMGTPTNGNKWGHPHNK